MSYITPEAFLKRIQKAKKQTPKLVQKALQESKLEKINQDNLLHGKDSEYGNMPQYSLKYQRAGVFYYAYKMRSNPLSEGRWDLKHWWGKQYDGLFYKSIKVKVTLKEVLFSTNYDPEYMKGIYQYKAKSKIIGINRQQLIKAQKDNIPKLQKQILEIINEGK